MTDIAGLIERLEKSTGPDRDLAADICEAVGFKVRRHSTTRYGRRAAAWAYLAPDRRWHAVEPILSSIDAALALAERVLPGESAMLYNYDLGWHASAWAEMAFTADLHLAVGTPPDMCEFHGQSYTLPLAILIATLRAALHPTDNDHGDGR